MDLCETEERDSDDEVFDLDLTAPDSGYSDTSGTFASGASPTWTASRQRLYPPTQPLHLYGAGGIQEEQCDRGTQTSSSSPPVESEPQRLFYGNAAYRLNCSEVFEVPRASTATHHDREDVLRTDAPSEERVEIRIGQKLQQIGDQFHSSYMERRNRNENRVDQPLWWRLLFLLFTLIFDPEENAGAAGQR
ncbi:bcl-2-modifying factor-like [Stegostoma tigrinum]|uniref:bcl-2-modifying factor-like n=1 Tax=Stegostoma tigrinum TaxID=3053191 RepID=UPI00202B69C3|nr:bcl-2-modifying factor-like [Stegostoma tigrinum]XP_048394016.1 bcl-2-modifying factor-like [Stegostoma tigrinum]